MNGDEEEYDDPYDPSIDYDAGVKIKRRNKRKVVIDDGRIGGPRRRHHPRIRADDMHEDKDSPAFRQGKAHGKVIEVINEKNTDKEDSEEEMEPA